MTKRNLDFPFSKPSDMSVEKYLLALLVATVKQAGGELTIPVKAIIEAEEESIVKSPSDEMTHLVLRSAPRGTDLLRTSWETPQPKPAKLQPPTENSERSQRAQVLDDLRLTLLEQARTQEPDPDARGRYPFRTVPNPQ